MTSFFTYESEQRVSRRLLASTLFAAAALSGCSGLDAPGDSCLGLPTPCVPSNGPGDSEQPGPGDADWSCLDDPMPLAPVPTAGAKVTYRLPVVDWVGGAPIKGLIVQKCATIDSSCSTPLDAIQPPDTRTNPNVPFELEEGFKGFLKILSTDGIIPGTNGMPDDTRNAYVPEVYYFGDTMFGDRTVQTIIQVLRAPILTQVAQNIQIQLEFTQALIVLRTLDCAGNPAAGVRFTINNTGEPYTLIGGIPNRPATLDPEDFIPTDPNGQAGFANVPPGYMFADAFVAATGQKINKTPFSATALAGQLTIIEVHARPYGTEAVADAP